MVKAGLHEGLVPCTELDLTDPDRVMLDDAFFGDATHANFQAVVLPNRAPSQLSAAELDALARFERTFKIRQFSSYTFPSVEVGLSLPEDTGYDGPLDGLTAHVSDAAKAGAFAYLNGELKFDDLDPNVAETHGYLAKPLSKSFTPFLTIPIPGAESTPGVFLGVYTEDGREQLVMTGELNPYQSQQQALFPGILNWLTYGVHLGTERNFLSVHVDGVFLRDARWSAHGHCTVGGDCDPESAPTEISLTTDDVDFLNDWQTKSGMKLDLLFNGSGYDSAVADGEFPAGQRLLDLRSSFRWVSRTYSNLNLGCIQDGSATQMRCKTDSDGAISWVGDQEIQDEIAKNLDFAARRELSIASDELVTGAHSGLRRAPEEPTDNPNLASALDATGIAWIASDASRELEQRSVGGARTVPRYPMNLFYNAATKADTVDEYNYLYTSASDGGSGACAHGAKSTCIAPLDLATGFDDYVVPNVAHTILMHVLSNSPRAHFVHQSNLAEERVLYPVLDRVLADYRSAFASSAEIVNASVAELGTELAHQTDWLDARPHVQAYIEGRKLILEVDDAAPLFVPLTIPEGAESDLGRYAGSRTGWSEVSSDGQTVMLPDSVGYVGASSPRSGK